MRLDYWIDRHVIGLRLAALAILTLVAFAATAAPTVTLTATPSSGVESADVTLTWSSTEATSCAASGGWSGPRATAGTEHILVVRASTTYTLECTGDAGPTRLSWTPPTTNTDGSPLLDLASYRVYASMNAAELGNATPIDVAAPASSYTFSYLAPGTWHFALQAVNAAGIPSVLSNVASKVIAPTTASASAAVTITPRPSPPVLETVETVVMGVRADWSSLRFVRTKQVGTVDLGVPCDARRDLGDGWYAVPRDAVTPTATLTAQVVARCST